MKFRTEIIPQKASKQISHRDKVLFIGSCFTENIGHKFIESGFQTNINPFGIIYNPLSICECLSRVAENKCFTEEELVKIGEFWKSYSHHGDFRSVNKEECLQMINSSLSQSHSFLAEANYVVLTLGTAWVYRLKEDNRVLANCHKLPSNLIERSLCDCDTMLESLLSCFEQCRSINPNVQFIITISPIRHWKEGYRDNMLSKSTLHLMVERFCKRTSSFYFPSYEIVMDDLRDYRFYDSDMLHPNAVAIEYIWDKFKQTWFSEDTQRLSSDFNRLNSMLNHRPFNPESEEYKKHLQKAEQLKNELYERIEKL
jgi:hypothetical protein